MLQWTWSITLIKYKLQYLFVSYVENTALKNSRILSSDSSCAIICLCAIVIQHCPGWSPAIEFPTPCLCGLTEAAVEEQLQGGDVSIRKPVNTLPLSLIKCRSTTLHYATDQNGCLLADRVFLFLPPASLCVCSPKHQRWLARVAGWCRDRVQSRLPTELTAAALPRPHLA